jgi:hypothetical protein
MMVDRKLFGARGIDAHNDFGGEVIAQVHAGRFLFPDEPSSGAGELLPGRESWFSGFHGL